jgi:hypothetical protein
MHRKALTIFVVALIVASAREASAQPVQNWTDRGYFNLNLGFESTSGTLNDAVTFSVYGENGTKDVLSAIDSGGFFDFSVGGRVWRNVSVGIGFHREASTGQASVSASVPSPIFTNSNRSAAFTVDDLGRSERAIHLQFGYMLPINEKVTVHVFAGPSFFRLTQDVVADVTFTEQPPFTSITAAPVIAERAESSTGGHIGGDVSYIFYDTGALKVGGGGFLRYSGTTIGVPMLGTAAIESKVGGLQIGFGARLRF